LELQPKEIQIINYIISLIREVEEEEGISTLYKVYFKQKLLINLLIYKGELCCRYFKRAKEEGEYDKNENFNKGSSKNEGKSKKEGNNKEE
jgi:hypothetical protein